MKELITIHQANALMWAVLVIAPVVGLVIGNRLKDAKAGLLGGLAVGGGNIVLWRVYNAITDQLGLDTVKNLLVNLVLFIGIGLILGLIFGLFTNKRHNRPT